MSKKFFYIDSGKAIELKEEKNGVFVSTIEVLRTGKVLDRKLTITKGMLEDFVKNFNNDVLGSEIQVNLSHNRGGEAAGWIKSLTIEGDILLAVVEWTSLGVEKIKDKRFKFTSSELDDRPDAKTGKLVKNVFIGVALTNIPAIKGMKAVTLNEKVQSYINNHNLMDKLKELFESLNKKETITLAEYKKFEEEAEEAKTDDNAEEVKEMEKDLEGKVEKDGDEGEGDDDAKKAKEVKKENEELKEKISKLEEGNKKNESLSERLTKLEASNKTLSEENKGLSDDINLKKLEEEVKDNHCLKQGEESTGFKNDKETITKVAKFMLSLSQDQQKEFKVLLSEVQTVDLTVRGGTPTPGSKSEDLADKIEEANEEARKRHAKNPERELHDHLSDVYNERNLTD